MVANWLPNQQKTPPRNTNGLMGIFSLKFLEIVVIIVIQSLSPCARYLIVSTLSGLSFNPTILGTVSHTYFTDGETEFGKTKQLAYCRARVARMPPTSIILETPGGLRQNTGKWRTLPCSFWCFYLLHCHDPQNLSPTGNKQGSQGWSHWDHCWPSESKWSEHSGFCTAGHPTALGPPGKSFQKAQWFTCM